VGWLIETGVEGVGKGRVSTIRKPDRVSQMARERYVTSSFRKKGSTGGVPGMFCWGGGAVFV